MKVSKALEMLSKHDPNEELIIEWWARDCAEIDGEEIPLDIWDKVAENYEFQEYTYSTMFDEILDDIYSTMESK